MTPTGVLLVTPIFLWGRRFLGLPRGTLLVDLALHRARICEPLTNINEIVKLMSWR
jgi:hypothetical protein